MHITTHYGANLELAFTLQEETSELCFTIDTDVPQDNRA